MVVLFFLDEKKKETVTWCGTGTEQRSPCVQFLAVMKCHATVARIGSVSSTENCLDNWRGIGGKWAEGKQKEWRKWPQRIDTFWIHFEAMMRKKQMGAGAERQRCFLLSVGRNYRLMKWLRPRWRFTHLTFKFERDGAIYQIPQRVPDDSNGHERRSLTFLIQLILRCP